METPFRRRVYEALTITVILNGAQTAGNRQPVMDLNGHPKSDYFHHACNALPGKKRFSVRRLNKVIMERIDIRQGPSRINGRPFLILIFPSPFHSLSPH
jgi:hypothetical protein